jgi:hypothetical protein
MKIFLDGIARLWMEFFENCDKVDNDNEGAGQAGTNLCFFSSFLSPPGRYLRLFLNYCFAIVNEKRGKNIVECRAYMQKPSPLNNIREPISVEAKSRRPN